MRGKYLKVFGECAERIYAHMEKTQKGSWRTLLTRQEFKSVNIYVNNNTNKKNILIHTYYTIWDGLKVGTNENGSACGRWLSIGI
jgi:hypothetical protein